MEYNHQRDEDVVAFLKEVVTTNFTTPHYDVQLVTKEELFRNINETNPLKRQEGLVNANATNLLDDILGDCSALDEMTLKLMTYGIINTKIGIWKDLSTQHASVLVAIDWLNVDDVELDKEMARYRRMTAPIVKSKRGKK